MLSNRIARFIQTNYHLWQNTRHSSSKSLLADLRKKTGYTFSNCKKALELHANDLEKAENWLKEQAQALGWTKAEKLKGRTTTQGVIAVAVNEGYGSLLEVNCETDFVARNKQFQGLADLVSSAVLNHVSAQKILEGPINRIILDSDALKTLTALDGKSVADHSALTIGNIGENISVKRALCMSVSPDICLSGYTHPAPIDPIPVSFGKYGAMVAFKTVDDKVSIGKQLCQHIIGMNPSKIGDPEVDQPAKNADDETVLIHQEFLLDNSISVKQFLEETQTQILDFARFEIGEVVEGQQSLDTVETAG